MISRSKWRLRLSGPATRDFIQILNWTDETFGARQARAYEALLRRAMGKIAHDPFVTASRERESELGVGLRTLRVDGRGRHLVIYKVRDDEVLIIRILHDSMDIARHLPAAEE